MDLAPRRRGFRSARAAALAFLLAASTPLAARAQTLLFSSGFEPGTTVAQVAQADCWTTGCWQRIQGTDASTGFSWPPNLGPAWGGATTTAIQLFADAPVDATSVHDRLFSQLVNVTGHKGTKTNVLYSQLTQSGCCGGDPQETTSTQNAFQIQPNTEGGDLYISYWLKYQPDLDRQLNWPTPLVFGNPNWRSLFAWKTGTPGFDDGDYRVLVEAVSWCVNATAPCWWIQGDNNAGAGGSGDPNDPTCVLCWIETNTTVPVPAQGQWFKFEVFWHRSDGTNPLDVGRVWMAVNGQPIVDHRGPNKIPGGKSISRIFPGSVYGSGPYPLYHAMDDLQIWSGFPPTCNDPPCAPH